MGAVTVGYKCHGSWHLASGVHQLGIGWAPWRGGRGLPPFQCIPGCAVVWICLLALDASADALPLAWLLAGVARKVACALTVGRTCTQGIVLVLGQFDERHGTKYPLEEPH